MSHNDVEAIIIMGIFMSKKLILLVEDDELIRSVMVDFIEIDGIYNVIAIENGIKAYEWLSRNPPPDIVITDFHMIGRGDILAQSVVRMEIPVIMLTNAVPVAVEALKELKIKVPVVSKMSGLNSIINLIDLYTSTKINRKTA